MNMLARDTKYKLNEKRLVFSNARQNRKNIVYQFAHFCSPTKLETSSTFVRYAESEKFNCMTENREKNP